MRARPKPCLTTDALVGLPCLFWQQRSPFESADRDLEVVYEPQVQPEKAHMEEEAAVTTLAIAKPWILALEATREYVDQRMEGIEQMLKPQDAFGAHYLLIFSCPPYN